MNTTVKCSACRRTFTGDSAYLRATIWPHAATHSGKRRVSFSSELILSCNCGECEFCRAKVPVAEETPQ